RFEDNITMLRDSGVDLKRIRRHWGEALRDEAKNSDKGKRALQVLEFLIEWISIVEVELDKFIQILHKRFLELESPK
ncbi:MAG: hypothetical protein ACFE8U_17350, partial [Candidatus Hermodarchaeota archaeon]